MRVLPDSTLDTSFARRRDPGERSGLGSSLQLLPSRNTLGGLPCNAFASGGDLGPPRGMEKVKPPHSSGLSLLPGIQAALLAVLLN